MPYLIDKHIYTLNFTHTHTLYKTLTLYITLNFTLTLYITTLLTFSFTQMCTQPKTDSL